MNGRTFVQEAFVQLIYGVIFLNGFKYKFVPFVFLVCVEDSSDECDFAVELSFDV